MRGQYGPYVQTEHRVLDLVCRGAKPAQLSHRPPRGRWLRIDIGFPEVRIAPTHPVSLLGGVDQEEEQRKRPRRYRALIHRQLIDV
jgi:hypothetical protein